MKYDYGYFEEDHLGQLGDVGLWRRILVFIGPFWAKVLQAVLLSLIISGATLTLPYLIRLAIDRYIVNMDLETGRRIRGLSLIAAQFAGVMGISFAANFFQVTILEQAGQRIMHAMRQRLFRHMLSLRLAFFNAHPVGGLVTRLTNDIQNMHEMFTTVIVTLFNQFVMLAGILIILLWMNWRLALLLTAITPLLAVISVAFSRLARDAFRKIRTGLAGINAFLQEAVSGMFIIQLFLRERDIYQRFRDLNVDYYRKTLYQIKLFGFFMPLIDVMNSLSLALIIWYGGGEIIQKRITLGILVAFISYMRLFFQPLRELSQQYSVVQSAMASAERIFQLLEKHEPLPAPADPLIPRKMSGSIAFHEVTFGYESGSPVIEDLSLQVNPGETVAIVGATGAGKTTLINLLERFYDPPRGRICLDGIDIRQLDPHWLREQIGLVMQDVFVIPASLRDNILLDRELPESELRRIIDLAQLTRVVKNLPLGLDTAIGEGGLDLSAGQRQLLAFARVLVRNPSILVLDEATASVDSETEMLIEQAIQATLAHRTSIVIAHRLSTIRRADRILVMDHGRILEQGTHETLLAQQGLYHHLLTLQNGPYQEPVAV